MFVLPVQGIKGMEKFFLGRFLAGNKLDIVDQQDIDLAIALAEGRGIMRADRIDQVVGELFGRDVQYLQTLLVSGVADGMQQVCFSKTHPAIQEQRVVGFGRVIGDSLAGGVRQAVAGPHHKVFEGVACIQGGIGRGQGRDDLRLFIVSACFYFIIIFQIAMEYDKLDLLRTLH